MFLFAVTEERKNNLYFTLLSASVSSSPQVLIDFCAGDPLVYWVRAWTVKRQIRGSNPGRRMLLLSYNLNKNNNITRGIPLSPPKNHI